MPQSQPLNPNPVASLKDGVYHKTMQPDGRIHVAGVPFKIPRKYMQTFIEVEKGKVYVVNLDGERLYELESCEGSTGTMRTPL